METNDIIVNSLEYFDNNKDKYENITSKCKYINFVVSEQIIELYDDKQNIFYKGKYEYIGINVLESSTWIWSWSVPILSKKTTNISKQLLLYGLDITDEKYYDLKFALITSRFKILDKTQIDIYVALASYLSKKDFILILPIEPNYNKGQLIPVTVDNAVITYYLYIYDGEHVKN